MRALTAADLLAADNLRPGQEPTPEWGLDSCCYVAQLTALERDELEVAWGEYKKANNDDDSNVGIRAFFVAYCLCDQRNVRLFQAPAEYLAAAASLNAKHASPVSRLFDLTCRKNGLLKRDVEQLAKNSPGSATGQPTEQPSDDGNGESPSPSAEPAASSLHESPPPNMPNLKRSRGSNR